MYIANSLSVFVLGSNGSTVLFSLAHARIFFHLSLPTNKTNRRE